LEKCGAELFRETLARGGARPEVWIRFPRQLGDVIFSIPFLGSLQQHWNAEAAKLGLELKWVAVGHAIGASVFSEANPAFIAENVIEGGGLDKPDPWQLLRRWRKDRPVAVINLSQSVRLALAAWMAGVPIRGGIADNRLRLLYTHPFLYRDLPDIHIVQRYEPLLRQLTGSSSIQWLPLEPHRLGGTGGMPLLRAQGWDGGPFVTLAVGTRGFNKRWFPERERWPALAALLKDQGLTAVWLGGPDEVPLGAELAALAPGSINLTGLTSIPEACAIQYHAYGNVAIDTGLAHTAAATGRPLITIMGASTEHLISPQGPYALTVRGPSLDTRAGQAAGDPCGSSSHRISPERVAGLLHALAAEAAGQQLPPALPVAGGRPCA
jgi:ADP-heptose:LPS heptosyltransferase